MGGCLSKTETLPPAGAPGGPGGPSVHGGSAQTGSTRHGGSKNGGSRHGGKAAAGGSAHPGVPPVEEGPPTFGINETHEVISELGRGGTGETWLCRVKADESLVAIKFIPRPIPKVVAPMIRAEIAIQGDIGEGHINIVNAHEALLTKSHLALIMEYAAGGSLTQYVTERWDSVGERGGLFLSEPEARYFFRQFVQAVEYCHSHHVAHRDLKLDNTLLDGSDPPYIKICDFGFAKDWGDNEQANMQTTIGTPVYMSPQLINSKSGIKGYSGKAADVWASGVMLFVMLLGMFPFDHCEHPDPNTSAAHIEVWLQQIKSNWRENARVAEAAEKLSPECRDLLDKIFNLDETKRATVPEVKSHPWYKKPLLPKHEAALAKLAADQAEVDRIASDPMGKPAHLKRERDRGLDGLMADATRTAFSHSSSRVDLRRLASANRNMMAEESTSGVLKTEDVVLS